MKSASLVIRINECIDEQYEDGRNQYEPMNDSMNETMNESRLNHERINAYIHARFMTHQGMNQ